MFYRMNQQVIVFHLYNNRFIEECIFLPIKLIDSSIVSIIIISRKLKHHKSTFRPLRSTIIS